MTLKNVFEKFTLSYLFGIVLALIIYIVDINLKISSVVLILSATLYSCTTYGKFHRYFLNKDEKTIVLFGFSIINLTIQILMMLIFIKVYPIEDPSKVILINIGVSVFVHPVIIFLSIILAEKQLIRKGFIKNEDIPNNKLKKDMGLFIVILFVVIALLAPLIATHDPKVINLPESLNTPTLDHIMGQDQNGSDIFSRIVHGARISLFTGLTVVFISSVVGIFLGLVSGFYGGLIDTVLMRIVDVLLAFPGLLLAIAIVAVMGPHILNVVIALSVLGWVSFARLVRGQVLAVKEREFVYAARTSGQSDLRVMFMHILPNIMSPVIVQATFSIAGVIIAESSLSFLGLGAPPGTPSWGLMLSEGTKELLDAPHVSIFPGAAIMLLVIAFNFIGDGLRDLLDPKTEKK